MDFLELAEKRYSVRSYLRKPVEREKIERCLEAARLAPSACNSQPWEFIVIDKPEMKEKVINYFTGELISFNNFVEGAPVLIVAVTSRPNLASRTGGFIRRTPFELIDTGIAVEHMCLQAVEEGLGTCILGWFDEKGVKKALEITGNRRVFLVVTMGYPSEDKIKPKQRKELSSMVFYNNYS